MTNPSSPTNYPKCSLISKNANPSFSHSKTFYSFFSFLRSQKQKR